MITKTYDLTDAVTYHIGGFPPGSLDYEVLLGSLEEAAASFARYDAKMSGMVNSAELFPSESSTLTMSWLMLVSASIR